MDQQSTYELLPLLWWQNPWYLFCLVGIAFACVCIVWLLWQRRKLGPHQRILRKIRLLQNMPMHTHEAQKLFYTQATMLLREYMAIHVDTKYLRYTDEEIQQDLAVVQIPEQLGQALSRLYTHAIPGKFSLHFHMHQALHHDIRDLIKLLEEYTKFIIATSPRR